MLTGMTVAGAISLLNALEQGQVGWESSLIPVGPLDVKDLAMEFVG